MGPFEWDIDEVTGVGLLKVPTNAPSYTRFEMWDKLEEMGYQVRPSDEFWHTIGDHEYFQILPKEVMV